ncbi:MAG: HAD hydrolase-like protein [Desulfobacterales bacterium]|nr:HAD hydrolase-like protein [Desulfobacterales bacterium]
MVIWLDFDGTILNVKKRYVSVYQKICNDIKIKPMEPNQYWECLCNGLSTKNILGNDCPEDIYAKFIQLRTTLIEAPDFLAMDNMRDGAFTTIKKLKAIGIILILLTGRDNRKNLLNQLSKLELKDNFHQIYNASPYGGWQAKAYVLKQFAQKEDMIFGDTPSDILAGIHSSIRTCALHGGMSTDSRLRKANPNFEATKFEQILSFV